MKRVLRHSKEFTGHFTVPLISNCPVESSEYAATKLLILNGINELTIMNGTTGQTGQPKSDRYTSSCSVPCRRRAVAAVRGAGFVYSDLKHCPVDEKVSRKGISDCNCRVFHGTSHGTVGNSRDTFLSRDHENATGTGFCSRTDAKHPAKPHKHPVLQKGLYDLPTSPRRHPSTPPARQPIRRTQISCTYRPSSTP
jgi:hypothetical protein